MLTATNRWGFLLFFLFIFLSRIKTSGSEKIHPSKPGACFSKVPKLFGCISGDIILFVSSKRRRLEARNFAITFIFIAFTTY